MQSSIELVSYDTTAGVGLGFGGIILGTEKTYLHAVLFTGNAIEGAAEAIAAYVVTIGAGMRAGDEFPIGTIISVDRETAYTKLGGSANGITGEGDFEVAAAEAGDGGAVAVEVVAVSFFSSKGRYIQHKQHKAKNQSKYTLHK